MNIIIRTARPEDAMQIAGLSAQLRYRTKHNATAGRLSAILSDVNNTVLVAVDGDKVVGWIHGFYSMRIESDAFVEIGGLITDEHYRRKGIGTMLVQAVDAWSQQLYNGHLRVRCKTERTNAHEFYKRLGFEEIKEQKIFSKKATGNGGKQQ